jgi:methylated-DNA-[protein]-cysteine S-methyltransferase
MMTFRDRVLKIVSRIPKGKTMSYGEVAFLAGSPGGARAVGNIMKNNWDPTIPCHRVVRSDGQPGGYNRGRRNKIRILRKEGAI